MEKEMHQNRFIVSDIENRAAVVHAASYSFGKYRQSICLEWER